MLQRVRERLLHDPVRGQVDAGRQRSGLPLDRDGHRQTCVAHSLHQMIEVLHAGSRLAVLIVRLVHEQIQQSAQLLEAGTPGRVDGFQSPACRCDVGVEHSIGGLRLEHDHRKTVGDEVVQLSSDARALMGDRGTTGHLPVVLRGFGAFGQRVELAGGGAASTDPAPTCRPR